MTSTPGKTQVICFNFVSEWLMHEVSRPITYPELLSKTPILFYYDIPIHGRHTISKAILHTAN